MNKKIFILASFFSLISMAINANGKVNISYDGSYEIKKEGEISIGENRIEYSENLDKVYTLNAGIKTDIKINNLEFGATIKGKDIKFPLEKNIVFLTPKDSFLNVLKGKGYVVDKILNNSSTYLKYNLKKSKGYEGSFGLNLNLKSKIRGEYDKNIYGEIEIEEDKKLNLSKSNLVLKGELIKNLDNIKLKVNTNTNFPFEKEEYSQKVNSTHSLEIDTKYIDVNGSIKHSYSKDFLKYISLKFKGKYEKGNLKLIPQANFKYQFNGEFDATDEMLGDIDLFKEKLKFYEFAMIEKYALEELAGNLNIDQIESGLTKEELLEEIKRVDEDLKYGIKENIYYIDGVNNINPFGNSYYDKYFIDSFALKGIYNKKDLKIEFVPFINHINIKNNNLAYDTTYNMVYYGLNFKMDKEILNNLKLKLNSSIALSNLKSQTNFLFDNKLHTSYWNHKMFLMYKLNSNLMYDYTINNKLLITPEFEAQFRAFKAINVLEKYGFFSNKGVIHPQPLDNPDTHYFSFSLIPKLNINYEPIKNLKLISKLEVPIIFASKLGVVKDMSDKYVKQNKFGYDSISFRTVFGLEYSW